MSDPSNLFSGGRPVRVGRRSPRSVQLTLETLEGRDLFSVGVLQPYPVGDSGPGPLVDVSGTLFFTRTDDSQGLQLWKTDGTSANTVEVRGWALGYWATKNPQLTNVNGTLFFVANGGYGEELWKSDGTAAGTVQVADIVPGPGDSNPTDLVDFNGTLFFAADDETHGQQLWKSDGTASGTVMVLDLNPSPGGLGQTVNQVWSVGPSLFFETTWSSPDGETGNTSLWESDGTAAGTRQISLPNGLVPFENFSQVLYDNGAFYVNGGAYLWKIDRTGTAVTLVQTGDPSLSTLSIDQVAAANGDVYFTEFTQTGSTLWRTDGSFPGTIQLTQAFSSNLNEGLLFDSTNVGGTLFFVADDGTHGSQLWKSDGTPAGTVMVTDNNPAGGGLDPLELTNLNNTLFFSAVDGTAGDQIWRSDGTATGTVAVTDIVSDGPGLNLSHLQALHGALYFQVEAASARQERLWKTAGTSEVASFNTDIYPPLYFGPPWLPTTTVATVGTGASQQILAVTPAGQLQEHTVASGWRKLGDNIQSISVATEQTPLHKVVVFALTSEYALFRYADSSGWQMIGAPDTVQEISAGTDSTGRAAVFVIGGDTALSEWSGSSGWLPSPIGGAGSIDSISATTANRVVVTTTDHSVFEHDDHFGWFPLTSKNFAQSVSTVIDASERLVVFATTVDGGLFRHEDATGWTQLGASGTIQTSVPFMPVPMSAGLDARGRADVFVVTTSKHLAENDSLTGWSMLAAPGAPASVAGSTLGGVIVLMSDGSIVAHDDVSGFLPLAGAGLASVDPQFFEGG
jgi:ELWxxDGT repeat protein